jgi:hypothetical protein
MSGRCRRLFAGLLLCGFVSLGMASVGASLGQPTGRKPHVVFLVGEDAHKSEETLPAFAKALEDRYALRCTVLLTKDGPTDRANLPGLEALAEADVAVFALRDRELPEQQMKLIRTYLGAGKPLVAIRTTTHAFSNWREFGPEVLGTGWKKHFGLASNTDVRRDPGAGQHPILAGLDSAFPSRSCLYEVVPLPKSAKPLLLGTSVGPGDGREDERPVQPVAWTIERQNRRAFCTTLGVPEDYRRGPFRHLLVNAIFWAMDRPLPKSAKPFDSPTKLPPAKFTIPVHAIRVSDDDGSRLTPISPVQVKAWVDYANGVFAPAGVRFRFDPRADGPDWTELKHTAINSMAGGADANWRESARAANAEAAGRPGKLVVFLRHGPGKNPTGGGFSWIDYNFVVAPGYWNTFVPSGQNQGLLAHEFGHFLGLAHTFGPEFKTVKEAEEFLLTKGRDPKVFDGDGFSDTPPDPFIVELNGKLPAKSLMLANVPFTPDRGNIMSYWDHDTKTISKLQAQRVTATLQTHPHRRTLVDPKLVKKLPANPRRLAWVHSRGSFQADGRGGWVEAIDANQHVFAEIDRNAEFVTLKNIRADVWVKLYADRCEVKLNEKADFAPMYFGVWEK